MPYTHVSIKALLSPIEALFSRHLTYDTMPYTLVLTCKAALALAQKGVEGGEGGGGRRGGARARSIPCTLTSLSTPQKKIENKSRSMRTLAYE